MTIEDIYDTMAYGTTVILRVFGEINKPEDAVSNYKDIIATRDNIQDYMGLSIMCIVADAKDKIIIELA
jgi:hypothetical protein